MSFLTANPTLLGAAEAPDATNEIAQLPRLHQRRRRRECQSGCAYRCVPVLLRGTQAAAASTC